VPNALPNSFEALLAQSTLPPPGPSHYAARRALWLASPAESSPTHSDSSSSSRQRLELLLNSPDAVHNDQTWKSGVEKVWKGLNAGQRLKRRLPMSLVIKILHSAWLRDDTWPVGMRAPEPDDMVPDELLPQIYASTAAPTEYPSGVTTPWTVHEAEEFPSGMVVDAMD